MIARKVTGGALAGALSIIVVWGINTFVLTAPGPQITGEVGSAITTVFSFAVSYLVTE